MPIVVEAGAWLDRLRIRPFFQPIIDLSSGSPLGYEILSRGTAPFGSPAVMFQVARESDLLWDLERACRTAALQGIAGLPPHLRGSRFFLNVSPQILSDNRFVEGFTLGMLQKLGLDQGNVVIEITEQESIRDYRRFEALIRHYVEQGFRISLDDFGSGHSSLVTLVRCVPHFLKLDHEIVRQVERTPYKQQLVKALVAFSTSVGAELIAEGVETWPELEALVALGVRHAQGFLLARPWPEPMELEPATRERLSRVVQGVESFP
ncbi:MAG TPA: EAL domain-containing protein [Thermoanaerobaculia bacterium]|nr:EAL domain-containing protein [Thermoanaerobaculia bacterium]